jgi:hypothetical protein
MIEEVACTSSDELDPVEVDDAERNDHVVEATPEVDGGARLAVALAILTLASFSSFGTPSG